MSTLGICFLLSALAVVSLAFLFKKEEERGIRFGEGMRRRADAITLRVLSRVQRGMQSLGRSITRQMVHFTLHTILLFVLSAIKKIEKSLRSMIVTNKTIARNVERDNTALTKLEEVALHKAANALSEEEKKEHREKTLNGL